ncbi:MAG: helix-turn-helix transcriptional regulator [Kordiimonadaceae bacterium]|nr:helix-turn-helix transcriptional regulator [Kordiimonadaceae bacterium]
MFDNFLRFGGITLCLFGLMLMLHLAKGRISMRLGAAFAVGAVAYLLGTFPEFGEALGYANAIILTLKIMAMWMTWLFCLSLFDDAFRLKPFHWAVGVVLMGFWAVQNGMYYNHFGTADLMCQANQFPVFFAEVANAEAVSVGIWLIELAIAGHMLFVALSGMLGDLVEKRRRLRVVFVTGVAILYLMILGSDWLLGQSSPQIKGMVATLKHAWLFSVLAYLMWHMAVGGADWLFGSVDKTDDSSQLRRAHDNDNSFELAKIDRFTGDDTLLEPELTITRLAEISRIPEHRLRRLINQHLGFRNFADFLNKYRIDAAKVRLSDVAEHNTQVLVIAMDLGYGSLGPFNRAFKARTGQTPTEFRKQAQTAAE